MSVAIAMHPFQEYERLNKPIQNFFPEYHAKIINFFENYQGTLIVFEQSENIDLTRQKIDGLRKSRNLETIYVETEKKSNTPINLEKDDLIRVIKKHETPVLLTGGNIQRHSYADLFEGCLGCLANELKRNNIVIEILQPLTFNYYGLFL